MTRGYGVTGGKRINGKKSASVHRVMAAIVFGPIPEGFMVCHTCDNVRCLNPDHLFLGTAKDNQQDRIRKGRGNYKGPKGFRFTPEQARARYVKMVATAALRGRLIGGQRGSRKVLKKNS